MNFKVVVPKRYCFTEIVILNSVCCTLKVVDINLLRYVEGLIGLRSLHLNARHPLRGMEIAKNSGSDAWM